MVSLVGVFISAIFNFTICRWHATLFFTCTRSPQFPQFPPYWTA